MSPEFSVIVPTVGRVESLRRCVQSLLAQSVPRESYEIVVVDDGSQRDLSEIALLSPDTVKLIRKSRGGPAAARNYGVAQCSGAYLAFLDDDCFAGERWLFDFQQCLEAQPDALFAGEVGYPRDCNLYVLASHLIITYLEESGRKPFAPSCNLAVARKGFLELGGFSEHFPMAAAEDRDFCDRWTALGRPLLKSQASVVHGPDLGLHSFLRQHFRYGRGARRYQKHSPGGHWQSPLFYLNLPLAGVRTVGGSRGLRVIAPLVLSQVAHLAGYLWEKLLKDSEAGSD